MWDAERGRRLLEAYGTVPDPRGSRGRRHAVAAMLALATAAMLSGARSLLAITGWGRAQDAATVRALGFARGRTPAIGTLHTLFRRLDAEAVEAAVRAWAQASAQDIDDAIAIDGKPICGTYGEGRSGLMVLSAYTHRAGQVLAQTGGADRRS